MEWVSAADDGTARRISGIIMAGRVDDARRKRTRAVRCGSSRRDFLIFFYKTVARRQLVRGARHARVPQQDG